MFYFIGLVPGIAEGDIGNMTVVIRPSLEVISQRDGSTRFEFFRQAFGAYRDEELWKSKACIGSQFDGIEKAFGFSLVSHPEILWLLTP